MSIPAARPAWPGGAARVLRAQAGRLAATAALVTAVAAAFAVLLPPTYRSTAQVLVAPAVTSSSASAHPPSMGTEKALVTSEVVAARAAPALGLTVEDLLDALRVTVPVETQILEIACDARSAPAAQRCAQTVAEAYVGYKDSQSIRTLPERGRIVTPAALPPEPAAPDVPLVLAAGLVAGLALGLAVAFVRDRLDDRVRGAAELASRLDVLAVVDDAPAVADRIGAATLPAGDAHTYGALAAKARVLMRRGAEPPDRWQVPALAVLAADPDRDGRTVAVGVALARSGGGERVVLVDADRRAVDLAPDDTGAGLVGVLDGTTSATAALQGTAVPRLALLPFGSAGPAAVRPVAGRWQDAVADLGRSTDLLVVATGPIGSADGIGVVEHATAVLLVVEEGHTTRRAVDGFLDDCAQLGVHPLGAVLVRPRARRPRERRAPATSEPAAPRGVVARGAAMPRRPAGSDALPG